MSTTSPNRFVRLSAAVMATLALAAACGDDATPDAGSPTTTTVAVAPSGQTLTGTVIAATGSGDIPAGATVVVELADTSLQDAAATVIARREYTDLTSFPFTYELAWDDELETGRDYTISVQVAGDDPVYITDTAFTVEPGDTDVDFYVIGFRDGPVDMEVEPAVAFGATIIGETEDDAIAAIAADGFEYRIAERDGEGFALTDDWRPNRINLTVNDGIVTDFYVS